MENKVILALLVLTALTSAGLAGLYVPDLELFSQADPIEKYDSVSEIDKSVAPIEDYSSDYRFYNIDGKTIYGPYTLKGQEYYYYDNEVWNNNLSQTDKPEIEYLHNFYIKTYTDPLFYSPSWEKTNFSKYQKFEDDKILAEECGLKYDIIPVEYLNSLNENNNKTEEFLTQPSVEKAENLIEQNQKTASGYASYVTQFAKLLNKNLEGNKCFKENLNESIEYRFVTLTLNAHSISEDTLVNYTRTANENAAALQTDIQGRQSILEGNNLPKLQSRDYHKSEKQTSDNTVVQDGSEAKKIINGRREEEYTNYRLNDSLQKKEIESQPRRYNLQLKCPNPQDGQVPVYGTTENIYPNLLSAAPVKDRVLGNDTSNLETNPTEVKDFFSVCRCPYVEQTRLNWYVIDELYQEISENPLKQENTPGKIADAEREFIEEKSQSKLQNLSIAYEKELTKSIKEGNYNQEIPEMWRRSLKQQSKLHKFNSAYEDYFNQYHMDIWDDYFEYFDYSNESAPEEEKFTKKRYYFFLLMESEYALNFMTWSDQVWRLDEKPEMFKGKY